MNPQAELLRLRVNGLAAELEFAAARHALARAAARTTDDVVGTVDGLIEGKSMTSDGLLIEGQAGGVAIDRKGDSFLPGVLARGVQTYMRQNPVLCYHHDTGAALGVVEKAYADGAGNLRIRARLDDPEPGTPLSDVWKKVKSGTIKGLSVGGIFKRKMTPEGVRIYAADIYEISITPVPMERNSLFTVVGKAVGAESAPAQLRQLRQLSEAVDMLAQVVAK